ncbi:hypothetical protein [Nocardia jinanensis]|uniref:hypothetical protein n=1 Tax=Nocardia jinanensis TaxID=382504 RepID=UPI00166D4719|nr:hypothetical protein [Nocardia jinanensis]
MREQGRSKKRRDRALPNFVNGEYCIHLATAINGPLLEFVNRSGIDTNTPSVATDRFYGNDSVNMMHILLIRAGIGRMVPAAGQSATL